MHLNKLISCNYTCKFWAFKPINYLYCTKKFYASLETDKKTAKITRKIIEDDIIKFGELSGDLNPIHFDDKTAKKQNLKSAVVHGAFLNCFVSAVIGTQLPGPGCVVAKQELNYTAPCYVGEEITVTVQLEDIKPRKIVTVTYNCITSDGRTVLHGKAKVIPPPKL